MNSIGDMRVQLDKQGIGDAPSVASAQPGQGRWSWMMQRRRTRSVLLQLDDAQLRDVGLTREQARQEGGKPFWRD
ncbi:DUF1127 domain-containing protein [Pseudomonas capeferrum]|uniref:DUF1127 domain-containing protein n=1 Tax=Pseudomonas capeferrum TaxID=1495066 RepID=UPI0015E35D28|nr:DUF1127 domain-containing protein [Pseudomonas capeferrum]MBA1204058.1 DUF1127 domain-containing protein [Pseudomonas capeferrum]